MNKPHALPATLQPRDGTRLPDPIARMLTETDNATLKHPLRRGAGENTLRATRSDLGYLEAWSLACDGEAFCWPPTKEIALGDHYANRRGVDHPFSASEVAKTLGEAIRASSRVPRKNSKRVVNMSMIEDHRDLQIEAAVFDDIEGAGHRLRGSQNRALLAVTFASGGRRRSEISDLMWGHELEPIEVDDPNVGDGIPSMGLNLGRTKTTDVGEMATDFISRRAAVALTEWQTAVISTSGPVFRRTSRWGNIYETSISAHSMNAVLKRRLAEIGHDPGHGVRAGYITSALKAGIPAPEVVEQTLHRSLDTLL